MEKEGRGKTWGGRGAHPAMAGFEEEARGPQAKEHRKPLEARNGPQLKASEEAGTSVLQLQGLKFCQQSSEQEVDPALEPSARNTDHHHLGFSLVLLISNFQPMEL